MSALSSVGSSSLTPTPTASSSSSSPAGSPPITINGLASGLNTDQIVQGLLAVDQQQISLLQNQEAKVTAQQTAFKGIEAQLLTLQGDMTNLGKSQNGVFDARTATSSNTNLVSAAASSSAAPGVYQMRINSLAQANELASQGYDSANSAITQGTFTIGTASGASATLTIDNTNDTLQGLATAINNAGVGVSATVVNDGSGAGTQPYRLLLTATQTGTSNAITITNNLAADGGGGVRPVLDANYVGPADLSANYNGTSTPTANTGAGGYTGTSNNTYTFTVLSGGTVGTDSNLQIAYSDSTGANTGTITLNAGDAGVLQNVAQGIQVQFGAGTLVAGQTFTVKAYVPTVQQAANASITLGSGSGALTVQSATNQVNNLIGGVTLSLQGADPAQTVSVTVGSDTSKASQAIQSFVNDYNSLISFIDQRQSYDPTSGTAGPLLGNQQASDVEEQVRGVVENVVGGVNPRMNNLSELGITTNDQGQLVLNQAKLDSVLSGGVSGVSLTDVRNLFALSGTSSSPGLQFVTGSDKTLPSSTPYQVQISQAAQQASITATNGVAASTVINGTNNAFGITVDGASATITLAAGTYTPQALAQAVQSAINSSSSLTGRQVSVGLSGNQLQITSATYGSSSQVAVGQGTGLSALGFAGTESAQGKDVAGQFVVNGVVEPARGTGQFLTGDPTNANTANLEIRVLMTPSQVGGGAQGTVSVSRGIAAGLSVVLNQLLDPVSGRMKTIDNGYQSSLDGLQQRVTDETNTMNAKRQSLLSQFVAMETAVSQLQSIGNYLDAQFSTLPKFTTPTSSSSTSSSSSSG